MFENRVSPRQARASSGQKGELDVRCHIKWPASCLLAPGCTMDTELAGVAYCEYPCTRRAPVIWALCSRCHYPYARWALL